MHHIKPLDALTVPEICELARHAANREEPLEEANVFHGPARSVFAAAYAEHAAQIEFA